MIRRVVDGSGTIRYYNDNDQFHREDGPAVEYLNGGKWWFQYNMNHRTDGPAIDYPGNKVYYLFGKYLYQTQYNLALHALSEAPNQRWRKF